MNARQLNLLLASLCLIIMLLVPTPGYTDGEDETQASDVPEQFPADMAFREIDGVEYRIVMSPEIPLGETPTASVQARNTSDAAVETTIIVVVRTRDRMSMMSRVARPEPPAEVATVSLPVTLAPLEVRVFEVALPVEATPFTQYFVSIRAEGETANAPTGMLAMSFDNMAGQRPQLQNLAALNQQTGQQLRRGLAARTSQWRQGQPVRLPGDANTVLATFRVVAAQPNATADRAE